MATNASNSAPQGTRAPAAPSAPPASSPPVAASAAAPDAPAAPPSPRLYSDAVRNRPARSGGAPLTARKLHPEAVAEREQYPALRIPEIRLHIPVKSMKVVNTISVHVLKVLGYSPKLPLGDPKNPISTFSYTEDRIGVVLKDEKHVGKVSFSPLTYGDKVLAWTTELGTLVPIGIVAAPATATPRRLTAAMREFGVVSNLKPLELSCGATVGNWTGFLHVPPGGEVPKSIVLKSANKEIKILSGPILARCPTCEFMDPEMCNCVAPDCHPAVRKSRTMAGPACAPVATSAAVAAADPAPVASSINMPAAEVAASQAVPPASQSTRRAPPRKKGSTPQQVESSTSAIVSPAPIELHSPIVPAAQPAKTTHGRLPAVTQPKRSGKQPATSDMTAGPVSPSPKSKRVSLQQLPLLVRNAPADKLPRVVTEDSFYDAGSPDGSVVDRLLNDSPQSDPYCFTISPSKPIANPAIVSYAAPPLPPADRRGSRDHGNFTASSPDLPLNAEHSHHSARHPRLSGGVRRSPSEEPAFFPQHEHTGRRRATSAERSAQWKGVPNTRLQARRHADQAARNADIRDRFDLSQANQSMPAISSNASSERQAPQPAAEGGGGPPPSRRL
ncbi:hypothetical protein H4R20_001620 [Coemansia guatemalensis]|uniref:Uncharacterized protein n=1 Tax=Coemansia guatemalensis TaxID=2761395 RepID=A0A9W8I313_9FUNG|nr:hypothetical protein H4R20_001620 [Coemansia guatemalensis]